MISTKKRKIRFAVLSAFAGLLVSLTGLAVLPAQAQETTIVLERISAKKQSVEVLDAEGNSLGYGEFQAQISISHVGQISGMAELNMPTMTVQFNPTDLVLNKQVPLEMVMNGQFEITTDGQAKIFAGSIALKEGITSDLRIWDWPDDPLSTIDAAALAAVTELRFRE